ncbi:tyrosine-type recombinase/integrase [Lederbergia citri]|uniref:Tyrosine-type recombinase/integrase n=1 Tax=Lederbergia citri TaxID=2833580 RepID=A0A942YGC6_9BACI|nr:tyrosine-type recombinase/integrase [Lederbergia citri]MBS4195392.1 tyrosine-type recombinase/integrase [Lederbergia citri]
MARKTVKAEWLSQINKAAGRSISEKIISFDGAVADYLEHGEIKGLSEFTVKSYQKELKELRRVFVNNNVDLSDIRALSERDFAAFVKSQLDAGFARTTINVRLRTAKLFGNFCVRKKYTDENFASNVSTLKVRHEIGATFTRAQLKRLLDTPDITTFEGVRDLTIMRMFADTGMRLSELTSINLQDVSMADRSINLQRTKNRYARRIPLTKRLYSLLSIYLRIRGVNGSTDSLFITAGDEPINNRTVQYQIREHGRRSGVLSEVQCSPHVFRRTFAKFKIQAGVDIFTLQALMGHSDIGELRNYVAIYSTDLDDAIEKGAEYS